MATQKPIVSVVFDEETLKRIEDFQFHNRMASRSKAVNKLVLMALEEWELDQGIEKNLDDEHWNPEEKLDELMETLKQFKEKMKEG